MHIHKRQHQIIPIFTDLGTFTDWTFLDSLIKPFFYFLELEAYSGVVTALRAQGDLTKERRKVLQGFNSKIYYGNSFKKAMSFL